VDLHIRTARTSYPHAFQQVLRQLFRNFVSAIDAIKPMLAAYAARLWTC
jgi:hypothetical protein